MALADTCSSFQAAVADLAAKYSKTTEQVYQWWREYSNDCRNFDQSALLSEFEDWYKPKLSA